MLPKCFINYHKWTNSISLSAHYKYFMLVGCIFADKGGTGWEIHDKEHPSEGNIEIPFEMARLLSFLIDPKSPLTGNEEEELKKNGDWCFVMYSTPHGHWKQISGLMPHEAYLNAREAGYYKHADYSVYIFNSFEEAKKMYEEITDKI